MNIIIQNSCQTCGNKVQDIYETDSKGYIIACPTCRRQTPEQRTIYDAIAAWNRKNGGKDA